MTDNASTDLQTLYHQAFRDFGAVALRSMRPLEHPTRCDALAITAALRDRGRIDGRRWAERIEAACRAADQPCHVSMPGAASEGVVS
jgi:hypothetical protein